MKSAGVIIGGLAALGLGALLASVLDDDSDDVVINKQQQPSGTPNKQTPSPAQVAASLTCQQALDLVADATLVDSTEKILGSTGIDPSMLEAFAVSLETAAGSPGRAAMERAALLRLAQCVRAKKPATQQTQQQMAQSGEPLQIVEQRERPLQARRG